MRKFLAMVLLLTTAAALIGCGENSVEDRKEQAKYRRITPDEAQVLMKQEQEQDYLILDVRSPEEYAQGHIPHAINIPIERIGDVPPKELPDRNQTIFVYCSKGVRSMNVSNRLAHMGYKDIVEMGGLQDWNGELVK